MAVQIDTPHKIGIGAVQSFGYDRLVGDLATINPGWFYTWTPELPAFGIDGWAVGEGVGIGGTAADRSVVLDASPDAWIVQSTAVTAGRTYDFTLEATASAPASGGVAVTFHSAAGVQVGGDWRALDAGSGLVGIGGLLAPAGAVSAKIVAWGQEGLLEIDDVSLRIHSDNALRNGEMTARTNGTFGNWLSGSDVTVGGPKADRHAVLGASPDAWIFQDVPVSAGVVYDLSFDAHAIGDADGGIMVDFRDAGGKTLSTAWVPLSATGTADGISGIAAPAQAAKARIIAWNASGTLAIDDVSFRRSHPERIGNGAFEAVAMTDLDDLTGDYVPMIWGASDVTRDTLAALRGAPVVLGFNEPDHRDQANMSVGQALDLWPSLMETGARLGSPAATTPQTLGRDSWLGRFMEGVEQRDLKVDFVATHYYSKNQDVGAFETFLVKTHEAYDRPIWVTEWGLVDWNDRDRFSQEQTSAFFEEAVAMMDKLDFVERHAWFGLYDGMDNLDINTELFDDDGGLTPAGEAFRAFTRPDEGAKAASSASDAQRVVAEYGITHAGTGGVTVEFAHAYENPVVIATITTANDARPVSVRVSEVDADSFTLFLDNPNWLAPSGLLEQVSWIVAEEGRWDIGGGKEMQIGSTVTDKLSSRGSTAVDFHAAFEDAPVVLTTQQTARGSDMLWDRAGSVGRDGFALWLAEEERLNAGAHKAEKIGWLGISRSDGGTAGSTDAFEFRTSQPGLRIDHRATRLDLPAGDGDVVLAGISSHYGSDPAGLRIASAGNLPVTARIQEDTSKDAETAHVPELVDWLVLDGNGVVYGEDLLGMA